MIVKAGLLLFRGEQPDKELLFVRPEGKDHYVFPGGKKEKGETIIEAFVREIKEELSADARDIQALGVVKGYTPEGKPLTMHLYTAILLGKLVASSEIEELAWMSRNVALAHRDVMTPMTLERIFPFLEQKGIW